MNTIKNSHVIRPRNRILFVWSSSGPLAEMSSTRLLRGFMWIIRRPSRWVTSKKSSRWRSRWFIRLFFMRSNKNSSWWWPQGFWKISHRILNYSDKMEQFTYIQHMNVFVVGSICFASAKQEDLLTDCGARVVISVKETPRVRVAWMQQGSLKARDYHPEPNPDKKAWWKIDRSVFKWGPWRKWSPLPVHHGNSLHKLHSPQISARLKTFHSDNSTIETSCFGLHTSETVRK